MTTENDTNEEASKQAILKDLYAKGWTIDRKGRPIPPADLKPEEITFGVDFFRKEGVLESLTDFEKTISVSQDLALSHREKMMNGFLDTMVQMRR